MTLIVGYITTQLWKRGKQVTEVHAKCRNMYLNEKSYKLFEAKRGFLIKSVRDHYRAILLEPGVKTIDINWSITLKWKLQQRFGKRVSFS